MARPDGAPRPDGRSDQERARDAFVTFERAVNRAVDQLRPDSVRTSARDTKPDLGFELTYQLPDRHYPFESLTVSHSHNLRHLRLDTRIVSQAGPNGELGFTQTQILRAKEKTLLITEPRQLDVEEMERVAKVADNPTMNAKLIGLIVEPTRKDDEEITSAIRTATRSENAVSLWHNQHAS
ncbi:MAG TPA: hypothetical protein VNA13_04870 [Xanthomonadales bacterium]|nr:hypothetical protein [Xanthomonadales bacterium]